MEPEVQQESNITPLHQKPSMPLVKSAAQVLALFSTQARLDLANDTSRRQAYAVMADHLGITVEELLKPPVAG